MQFQSKTDTAPEREPNLRRQRNRIAGLWAAELLGLLGQAARDYAHDVAHSHDHDQDGDEKLVQRLVKDLRGKVGGHEIREKLAHLVHEARRQLHGGDSHKP